MMCYMRKHPRSSQYSVIKPRYMKYIIYQPKHLISTSCLHTHTNLLSGFPVLGSGHGEPPLVWWACLLLYSIGCLLLSPKSDLKAPFSVEGTAAATVSKLCTLWLLAVALMRLQGQCFVTEEDIQCNATTDLCTIPTKALRECFQVWEDQWNKCMCADGTYVKDD